MKSSIRRIRRMLGGHFWDAAVATPVYASQVVSDEEVEQFIANIAATGFYDDATGQLVPASRERREGACDWVERSTEMDPVARTEFLLWARDTAQCTLYGHLSPSDKYPLILGNQAN